MIVALRHRGANTDDRGWNGGSGDHGRCRNYLGVTSGETEAVTRKEAPAGRSVGGQRASRGWGGTGWEGVNRVWRKGCLGVSPPLSLSQKVPVAFLKPYK